MAVAVAGITFVVLDEEYRIVEVGPAARAGFGPLVGRNVLDAFPGSRDLFLPYYEQARRTREVVEFAQFYDGYVMRVRAVPEDGRLTVFWETLAMLDVLTLDGLRASLQKALEQLEGAEEDLRRDRVRRSLHLVEGGA